MTPRKPATGPSGKVPAAAKKSNDRVNKRPARGYHTFKNGMLNVTPKGDERELVRNNQASPLLRLPPEIRNRIWHFVLGGKVIREQSLYTYGRSRFMPRPCERNHPFSLLETSRQIYAETALLPFTANTFSLGSHWRVKKNLKAFRKHQCGQIRELQFEFTAEDMVDSWLKDYLKSTFKNMQLRKWLPGLQRVHICVFSTWNWDRVSFTQCETYLRSELAPTMQHKGFELTWEKMGTTWSEFQMEWRRVRVDAPP